MSIQRYEYQDEQDEDLVAGNHKAQHSASVYADVMVSGFDQLHPILFKLPMPSCIPRNLHLRGTKKAQYIPMISKNTVYSGYATQLLQLLRMMKWYYFINDPLQEWRDIKAAIIQLLTDKKVLGVVAISR
jgi:hypothetical protein